MVLSNWHKPKLKFDVSNAKFQFDFSTDLEALKTNEGMIYECCSKITRTGAIGSKLLDIQY